jgi:hypothetical protein
MLISWESVIANKKRMITKGTNQALRDVLVKFDRILSLALAAVFISASFSFLNGTATAAQMTSRSVLISTGIAAAATDFTFTFTPSATTQIQSMRFTACTTALGACTAPAGLNIAAGTVGQSGFQGATSFTKDTTSGGCTTNNILCVTRTDATAQTLTSHAITMTGGTNQNGTNCSGAANCTFFVRMVSYSAANWTTPVDDGTVAGSTTQLFTVNATIQEALSFCVGATTINDATTATPDCSSVSGTSLNLGTLQPTTTSVSPVVAGNNGDGNNAIARLSTNASNGTNVTYKAFQQSGTNHQGTLRVGGATCNVGVVNTDQCINARGTTQGTITAGTEHFGMTVAAVNCAATTAYTCTFAGGTYNLIRDADYDGTGANTYPTDTDLVAGTTNAGYAWDESGTPDSIAASTTVVDAEALIIKFAATPNIVTPTGSYTALADFVATPTY